MKKSWCFLWAGKYGNIQVVYVDTQLAINGILKDFIKEGDSELSEINLFGWMDKKKWLLSK